MPRPPSPAQLIHKHINGPMTALSLSKSRQVMELTDDTTQHMALHFLRSHEQAFDALRNSILNMPIPWGSSRSWLRPAILQRQHLAQGLALPRDRSLRTSPLHTLPAKASAR